jgi:micrococcal nuclease
MTYEYKAIVENVVDGDTVDLVVDLGFKISSRQRVRLARIDTPERTQSGYAAARDFVRDAVLNKPVRLKTEKVSKWGYYLAEITLEDGQNLSDTLVQAQLAKYYDGGKKT